MGRINTLYLHIGTHKTGTTSIQHFLLDEACALARNGLEFFVGRRPKRNGKIDRLGNAWLLADQFLRKDLLTIMRLKHAEERGFIPARPMEKDRLRKLIVSSRCTQFLVSAESFCMARTAQELIHLKKYFALIECDVVPIICFRNTDDWRASFNNELVGMKYFGPTVAALPVHQRVDGDWYYSRAEIFAFWNQIGTVRTIDYDFAMAQEGSVIPSFMRAIERSCIKSSKDYLLNRRRP